MERRRGARLLMARGFDGGVARGFGVALSVLRAGLWRTGCAQEYGEIISVECIDLLGGHASFQWDELECRLDVEPL